MLTAITYVYHKALEYTYQQLWSMQLRNVFFYNYYLTKIRTAGNLSKIESVWTLRLCQPRWAERDKILIIINITLFFLEMS